MLQLKFPYYFSTNVFNTLISSNKNMIVDRNQVCYLPAWQRMEAIYLWKETYFQQLQISKLGSSVQTRKHVHLVSVMQAVLGIFIIWILALQNALFHFGRSRHSAGCLLSFWCSSKANLHRAKVEAPSSFSRDNLATSVSLGGKEAKSVETNVNLEACRNQSLLNVASVLAENRCLVF